MPDKDNNGGAASMARDAECIQSDVLIVGGGLAGCFAAMAAREAGASVVMVDKSNVDRSGDAGYGLADFQSYFPDLIAIDEATNLLSRWQWGIYDRDLCRNHLRLLPEMVDRLDRLGVRFRRDASGNLMNFQTGGLPLPLLLIENGSQLKRLIAQGARAAGAKDTGRVMVTGLLSSENGVTGAMGFNIRTGKAHVFRAKATILATGDTSRLYSNNAYRKPFWCHYGPFNTGSATAMAYEIGAECADLELGYANLEPRGFKVSGMGPLTALGAHLLNATGERYMLKYHPKAERGDRPTLIAATLQEIQEGRGPVYLDCRHFDQDAWNELDATMRILSVGYSQYVAERGIDLRTQPMEMDVTGVENFRGLMVNARAQTCVPGLFASGACTIFWLGMPGAITSGWTAGANAARSELPSPRSIPVTTQESALLASMFLPLTREHGMHFQELENILQLVMNTYVGFVRNEEGLNLALRKLRNIQERCQELKANDLHELMRCHEVMHMVQSALILTRGALERKETRCWHVRGDYPTRNDPNWQGHIAIRKGVNGMEARFKRTDGEDE